MRGWEPKLQFTQQHTRPGWLPSRSKLKILNPKPETRNAAQGAIGSMLKIDASYLSPHVNLAARLETGTHQFGVDILFSEQVFLLGVFA